MEKNANKTDFYYMNGKIITVKTGENFISIFGRSDGAVAEIQSDGNQTSKIYVTDAMGSVLGVQNKD
ncbi:hypothetical protein ACIP01_02170 [Pseudomonas monteilii]|uniref:hypothetical protein n=1 Tax=Pseudomonas monteilii TaxID=76759 RepID=UPI00381725C8